MSMIPQRVARYAMGYGLLIWFEATLIIRWMGDLIFVPESVPWTVGLYAVTPVLVYAVGWSFFWLFQTPRGERAASAILICATGLVANAAVIGWIDFVLPDLSTAQDRLYSSWIVWAYGIGLLSGLWPRHLVRVPAA